MGVVNAVTVDAPCLSKADRAAAGTLYLKSGRHAILTTRLARYTYYAAGTLYLLRGWHAILTTRPARRIGCAAVGRDWAGWIKRVQWDLWTQKVCWDLAPEVLQLTAS